MEILYLAALKDEIQGLKNFILTGVGKINASFVTTDMINKYHPKKIINFGTAGSTKKILMVLFNALILFNVIWM